MPVPTHPSDPKLDNLLRAALTAPQRHTVWAMLHDPILADGVSRNAEPIKAVVEIVAEAGALVWHPISGVTLGGQEVPERVLGSDRVWWCSWTRSFAAARLRVELEQRQEPAQSAADQALEGLEAAERRLIGRLIGLAAYKAFRDEVNGDKAFRVLAEFPPPRGYGGG